MEQKSFYKIVYYPGAFQNTKYVFCDSINKVQKVVSKIKKRCKTPNLLINVYKIIDITQNIKTNKQDNMDGICIDYTINGKNYSRFDIIEKAKEKLKSSTNITDEEQKVMDIFLFRIWQMGWLPESLLTEQEKELPIKY